jgi:hypothetical protein
MAKKSYDEWYKEVNDEVLRRIGLDLNDLPDCPFYQWYNAGVTYMSAASKAIKAAND